MNEDPLECSSTASRRSWRLIVDPLLTKAARKIYKYDDGPLPESTVRREDPRTRNVSKFDLPMNLPVPKLKVDENSRLSRELGIINLNETVTPDELKQACSSYGTVVKTRVLYHPTTKVPLLLGRVVFESLKSAQNFYGRFQNSQFLGKTVKLFRDYNGTKLHQLYKETIEKNRRICSTDDRSQSGNSSSKPVDEVDPRIYRLNTGVPVETPSAEAVGQTAIRNYQSCVPIVAPSVQPPGEPRFQYPQYSTQPPPGSLASPTFSNVPRPGIPPAPVPLVPAVAPPPTWPCSGSPPAPWQQQQAQFWQTAPPPSIRPAIAPPTVPPPPPGAPVQSAMPALASLANLPCPRAVPPGGTARPPPFLPFQRPPLAPVPYPPAPAVGANVAAVGANSKIVNYNTLRSIESIAPSAVTAVMGNTFGPSFLNGLVQNNATAPPSVSQLPGWNGGDINAFALRWKAATEFANTATISGGLNGQGEPAVKVSPVSSQASDAQQYGTARFTMGTTFNGAESLSTTRRRSDSSRHDLDPDVKRIKLSSSDAGSVTENHSFRRRCRHKSCCPKYKAARLAAISQEEKAVTAEMPEKEVEKIPLPQQSSMKVELASNSEAELAAEQASRSLSPFSSEDERESRCKTEAERNRRSGLAVTVKCPATPSNSDNDELDDGLEVKCYTKAGASYTPEGSERSDDSDSSVSPCSTSSRSSRSRRRRYSPLNALDERFSGASSQGAESMCISPANSNSPGNAEILQRKDSEAASSSKTPSLANLQPSTGHGIHSQFCGMTAATSTATFSCNSGPSSSTNFRDTKEKSAAQSWGRTSLESNSSPTSKKSGAENLSSTKVQAWRDAIINRCYTDISEELSVAIRGDLVRLILDFALSSFSSWKKSAPRKEASTQPDATPKHRKAMPRTPSSSPQLSDDDMEAKSDSSIESEIPPQVASKHGTPVCSDFEDERWSPTSGTLASTRSSDISRTEDSSNASTSVEAKVTDGEVCRTNAQPKRRTHSKNAVQSKSLVERRGRKRGRKGAANAKKPRRTKKASNVLFINLDEEDFHTGSDTALERSEEFKRSPHKPATVCWDGCMVIEGKYSPRQHDHGYSLGGSTVGQSPSSQDSSVCASLNFCESTFGYAWKGRKGNEKVEPECSFRLRSAKEEAAIIHSLNSTSLNCEDLAYLKSASALILSSIAEIPMLTLHWSRSTEQMLLRSLALRHQENPIHIAHKSGGARTEGFYRLSKKEKNLQAVRALQKFASEPDAVVKAPQAQELRAQTRAMQRLLFTNYGTETDSDWLKYDQMQTRKKLVRFDVSKIHGWGLFAMEDITPDEMIIEYVGQKIRMAVAERREEVYEKRGIGSSYLFRIDNEWVIDATNHGNLARFINHSCAPNCYAKVISVNSQKRIVIYSKQNIRRGEEITYDYKFPREDEKIPCNCRSFNCRGSLNCSVFSTTMVIAVFG